MKKNFALLLIPGLALLLGAAGKTETSDALRGVAQPSKTVVIKAPVDGTLAKVFLKENDKFTKDQVIGRMDNEMQKAVVENASLEIESKRLALSDAQIELDKMIALVKTDAAKDWEHRKALVKRDAADVAKKQAEAQFKLESVKLARYDLKTEFNGVMVRQAAQEGANLRIGDEVITLLQLDPLEAKLFLPVDLYGKLQTGKTYKLQAGHPLNRVIEAELKTFEPVIDAASQTFRATFTIPNQDLSLPSGFIVRLMPVE